MNLYSINEFLHIPMVNQGIMRPQRINEGNSNKPKKIILKEERMHPFLERKSEFRLIF